MRFILTLLLCLLISPAGAVSVPTLKGNASVDVISTPQPLERGIVGLTFNVYKNTWPDVFEVYPGTPAQKAGLLPGDVVLSINGRETKGLTLTQIDELVSDKPGDWVYFTVSRNNKRYSVKLQVMGISRIQTTQTRMLYQDLFGPTP